MNYQKKYLKYKNKYLDLKNQIILKGGASSSSSGDVNGASSSVSNNYLISLLWYNKTRGPIQQIGRDGNELGIRGKLLNAYNMFKIKYNNPNVILFLNYDKIIEEDFIFFESNNVVIEDVNEFNVFKTNPKLEQLFNPTKYKNPNNPEIYRDSCPVYIYVDMLKILIQYEQMLYKNYDYVIFSDYIIFDNVDRETLKDRTDIICKLPSLITEFTKDNLLDPITIKLLDNFGYLMTGYAIMSNLTEYGLRKYKAVEVDVENDPYAYPQYKKIDDKVKMLSVKSPENRFLMSKKSDNTIKAIKEYFIDYLFGTIIFDDPKQCLHGSLNNNFIFNKYPNFYTYLNFLNNITYIKYELDNFDFLHNNGFEENIDYIKISEKEIQIKSSTLYLYFVKNNKEYALSSFLTENGKKMIQENQSNIYPLISNDGFDYPILSNSNKNTTLLPSKCVPMPGQINSSTPIPC